MTRPRSDKPIRARRPASSEPSDWQPEPDTGPVDPPQIVPESLVESVLLRVDHAVRWANWDMVQRILDDARRQSREITQEALRPVEERTVDCLHELAHLPEAWIKPLRCVNRYAKRPVTIRELLDFGEPQLADHQPYDPARARMIFAAVQVARRQIDRRLQALTCWRLVC